MRVYSQKPRTALGWSGPLFQPNPFEKADVEAGILYVRKMMLDILEIGLPIADEALFLESSPYLNDLYSYVALGARSSEDHNHRVYASALDFPVGVKNPSSGNLEVAKNSVLAVNSAHSFLSLCGDDFCQIDSRGNDFGHLILRGGAGGPNYDEKTVRKSLEKISPLVKNPAIIIDLNHANSGKRAEKQPEILKEIMNYLEKDEKLNEKVKGFMVESFLKGGAQNINSLDEKSCDMSGLSITDPCLSFTESEKMIEWLYKKLS